MGAPYREDLRLRVLAAIDGKMSKSQAHRTFGVSRSTIDDWLRIRAKTGAVKATTDYYRGRPAALADSPELRAFIETHSGCTLSELAAAWHQEQGERLCVATFCKTLKRLGYTRKKRATATENAILKHERLLPKHSPS